MTTLDSDTSEAFRIGFELYGVKVAVEADSRELLDRVQAYLPPGVSTDHAANEGERFRLVNELDGSFRVISDATDVLASVDLEITLLVLDGELRRYIVEHAPDHIFVHAGVVGYRGQAIVIPGGSFSGKTTLVAELVRAGATYYSDEYAVLDGNGLVHPYARPLTIRDADLMPRRHPVEILGGSAGAEPLPVGLVVLAEYRAGVSWDPSALSSGEAALAVLANTLPAAKRPVQSLAAIRRAVERAIAIAGERSEAAAIVDDLLARLESDD